MVQLTSLLAVLVTSATLVSAHPGQSHESKLKELRERSAYIAQLENRDLVHCAAKLTKRGHHDGIVERRKEKLASLRRERGLDEHAPHYKIKRQTPPPFDLGALFGFGVKGTPSAALQKNHKSNLTLANPAHADWALLGQNKTTILHPEVTEGPYYVSGELVRKNVKDSEPGIDLHLDVQIVDINTCSPLPGVAVEMWSSNATGIYSGVVDFMNNYASDNATLNNQALRGFQISGKDGAIEFETIVPGHYTGRTQHIHVASHLNPKLEKNGTITSSQVLHVGQVYFDQDLLQQVESTPPYNANKSPVTLNKDDMLLTQGSAGGVDPIVEYVLLGPNIKDGVFAWINLGVDGKAKRKMMASTVCTEQGCTSSSGEFLKAIQPYIPALSGLWELAKTGLSGAVAAIGAATASKGATPPAAATPSAAAAPAASPVQAKNP